MDPVHSIASLVQAHPSIWWLTAWFVVIVFILALVDAGVPPEDN